MTSLDSTTQAKLARVRERIERAADAAGRRADPITLIAVSKTFGADRVREAIDAGQTRFGENYLQEARTKMAEISAIGQAQPLEWHFIGPIQSNKTREIAQGFDWVQSLDRLKDARRLDEQRPPGLARLNVLLQVNVSAEPSKRGVAPPEVAALAAQVATLPRLCLRGLMAIPEPHPDPAHRRAEFARMRHLLEALRGQLAGAAAAHLDTLSIGMSDDLEDAIAEGSTMVRIGTAIFGARQ
jgi:pyridoxal phosphate enzyme (YggS family)